MSVEGRRDCAGCDRAAAASERRGLGPAARYAVFGLREVQVRGARVHRRRCRSKEDAIALGVTGPPLRASGVDWDLRRDMPYSGYEKFKFEVPVSTVGDTWARYVVRMVEMRESIKICQQALDMLKGMSGPIVADAPKIVLPNREQMKTQMEALIHHFKIVTEGFGVPAGEVYQAVESPRGEMGYYVVSDGTAK